MEKVLTDKELKELRRLRNGLISTKIQIEDALGFLDGIQRLVEKPAAGTPRTRVSRKDERKNKYKLKLRKVA